MYKSTKPNASLNLKSTPKATSDNKTILPKQPKKNHNTMNLIGITASITALACLFLPFITLVTLKVSTSYSFIHHPRYKFFILPITAVTCLYLLKQQRIAFTVATINFVLLIYEIVPIIQLSRDLEPYSSYVSGNLSLGFYLLVVSSLVMMVAPFIEKYKVINKKWTLIPL